MLHFTSHVQVYTIIMKEVKIQEEHDIMYEKENDQLGKNSCWIKRCGEKCIPSIKKWTTSDIIPSP